MNYRKILIRILNQFTNSEKWSSGYFGKITLIPMKKRGDVGELFIQEVLEELNIKFKIPKSKAPWDVEVQGKRIEVKTASEDVNNNFQFNHVRYHREYDAILCIGIAPKEVYFNIWRKEEITTGRAGKLVSMEKNANASFKLTKRKEGLLTMDKFKKKLEDFLSESK